MPSISVLTAIVLAFVGIGLLVYFIHHVVTSVQASSILQLVSICRPGRIDARLAQRLNAVFTVKPYRTIDQDAAFGIQQLVDVALKALAPSSKDTTTTTQCID